MANKVIIIGAGATNGASTANPDLKPPLLKDLYKIFDLPDLSINHSKDGPILDKAFKDLLELTNTGEDIEEFFTLYQIIECIRIRHHPGSISLTKSQMDEIYSLPVLTSYNISEERVWNIRKIIEYHSMDSAVQLLNAPRNFYTFFQSALNEYMRHSLKSCICKYHAKLFGGLDPEDAVVTYNYDEVCDFTLFAAHKLNRNSFDGLGFSDITFPEEQGDFPGITFLKMHGSFNWWTDLSRDAFRNVYYNLQSASSAQKRKGEAFYDVILPFKHKPRIYDSIPIYKNHIDKLEECIRGAEEITLVGKNFDNSDRDLNYLLKTWSQERRKKLMIIDHSIEEKGFIKYHSQLFNAEYSGGWRSLEEFYKSQD